MQLPKSFHILVEMISVPSMLLQNVLIRIGDFNSKYFYGMGINQIVMLNFVRLCIEAQKDLFAPNNCLSTPFEELSADLSRED